MVERISDEVSTIAIFPIKSCQEATVYGEVPRSLTVGPTGFETNGVRDRDWALYDPNQQAVITQRGWGTPSQKVTHPADPRLATVTVDVREDHTVVRSAVGTLELGNTPKPGGEAVALDIFGKEFPAVTQGEDAAGYFSRLLEREVVLVRADRERERRLPDRYQRPSASNQVAGADGMPFLLASQATLDALQARNGVTDGAGPAPSVPIDRYRANIVIKGRALGAGGEDYIDTQTEFHIGVVGMWVVKACSRCPIPNIDQSSGEYDGNSLRMLRGRDGQIFTGEKGVFFGQNLVHRWVPGQVISSGDAVSIEAMSSSPNVQFRKAM